MAAGVRVSPAAAAAAAAAAAVGLSLNEIEVQHSSEGRPLLLLRGKAEAFRVSRQLRALLLSASDDGGFAVAHVIACS